MKSQVQESEEEGKPVAVTLIMKRTLMMTLKCETNAFVFK